MTTRCRVIWRCPACSIRARVPADTPRIFCKCGFRQLGGVTPGMGDYMAAALYRIGVTRRRYVQFKRLLGLKPHCQCAKRQASLNRVGRKLGIGA